MSQTTFDSMEISQEILSAVKKLGFTTATDIQAQSIPLILEGYDLIGRSQTGTGKTVAFGIPAVQKVDTELRNTAQILIMCPTRELAMQACGEIGKLSCDMDGIRAVDIYGGAPMQPQITGLKSANIVIGTPGRIMDHLRRKTLKLHDIKMVVLDEADEMLSMGFRDDIETILNETPEERQTVLFSATMPKEILALTKKYQKDPQTVSINAKQVAVDSVSQFYHEVPSSLKKDALDVLLKYHNASLSLVFCNTRRMVDELTQFLNKRGHCAEGLHGDIGQPQRTKIMDAFKNGKTAVLVATDVAARGIDVKNVEYVINYDIPQNAEYYVHRIGRTGRAGSEGCALTLCCGRNQVSELMQIGRQVKSEIRVRKMPTGQEIKNRQYNRNMDRVAKAIQTGELSYKDMVMDLVGKGFDPVSVAAAALEMCLGEPQPAQDIVFENAAPQRRSNDEFQKMMINLGRNDRVAPNHIVGAITEYAGLSGQDIGRIEIFDKKTVVSIVGDKIDRTIASMKGRTINGVAASASIYNGIGKSEGKSSGYSRNPNNFKRKPPAGRNSKRPEKKLFVEYC